MVLLFQHRPSIDKERGLVNVTRPRRLDKRKKSVKKGVSTRLGTHRGRPIGR